MAALWREGFGGPGKPKHGSRNKNAPKFDIRSYLFQICGMDFTRINGINATTVLRVIAKVGPDMSRFKSAKHFASWLDEIYIKVCTFTER